MRENATARGYPSPTVYRNVTLSVTMPPPRGKPCNYCLYTDICLHEGESKENEYAKLKFGECLELLEEEGEENA